MKSQAFPYFFKLSFARQWPKALPVRGALEVPLLHVSQEGPRWPVSSRLLHHLITRSKALCGLDPKAIGVVREAYLESRTELIRSGGALL